MNFKQAVGSENIYGVFNVFVKKIRVHLCNLWENKKIIRMANSCYSRYYIPLISGSTTIGAFLIVFVKAPLDILSLHIPDEPYDNYS